MAQLHRVWRRLSLIAAAGTMLMSWRASGVEDANANANANANAEAEGVVFERQQIMMQLGKDADDLGKIVAGQLPADRLPATTRAIARGAQDSVDAFAPQVPGGRARPEVWSNHADFRARMQKFAVNADAMAQAGESGDTGAVLGMMVEALPCKECHDLYREKKKS